MKTVYVETTVVSYQTAQPGRDVVIAARPQTTRDVWPELLLEFEACVSALVIQEGGRGDPDQASSRLQAIASLPILDIDDEARALAERVLAAGAVPEAYPEDALPIAVAALNGMQVLGTWNLAHLNNPFTRMAIREAVENAGYQGPEICSPEERLESEP